MTNVVKKVVTMAVSLALTAGVAITASAYCEHSGGSYHHPYSGNEAVYSFDGTSTEASTYCGDKGDYGSRYIESYVARKKTNGNIVNEDYDIVYSTDETARCKVTRVASNLSYYQHHAICIKPSVNNAYIIDSGSRDCR